MIAPRVGVLVSVCPLHTQVLLVLHKLTQVQDATHKKTVASLQKIIAFQSCFEKLLDVIAEEGYMTPCMQDTACCFLSSFSAHSRIRTLI